MATLIGTPASDTLSGTDDPDLILGRAGDDRLNGLAGDDALLGERGGDQVTGGVGDDTILGGPDGDLVFGDGGPQQGPAPRQPGQSVPPGTPLPGNNEIGGGGGDDTLYGGYGSDTVRGGAGDDRVFGAGPGVGPTPSAASFFNTLDGGDVLGGGAGNDRVEGGGGLDTLTGGAGDDTLWGGDGNGDRLTGGPGQDVFLFRFAEGPFPIRDTGVGEGNRDVVLDFRQGTDALDLSGYDNPFFFPSSEQPEAIFLGTGGFQAYYGLQIRYEVEDGRTVVQFYAPIGTPPPDVEIPVPSAPSGEIVLAGEHALTADDFVGLGEPVFTTLAVGEEGDDVEPDDGFATTAAIGEEGNPGFEEPVATTAALGEEGDPDHDFWSA